MFCGAPVLGIALALAAPNPTSLLESCSARSLAGETVSRYSPRYRDTASGIYRECCALSVVCARSPTCRPGSGSGLEEGSSRGVPPRADADAHPTVWGVVLVFRPEKPSAIVRALRCAQVLLTCGEPDSSRKLCPTRSGLAACAYFVGKLVLLSPVPGRCTARRALIGTSCLLGRKTRRRARVADGHRFTNSPRRTPHHVTFRGH